VSYTEWVSLSFDSGSALLSNQSEQVLSSLFSSPPPKFAGVLNGTFNKEVCVVGYSDPTGSDVQNHRLSERRAQAVAQRLAELGLPKQTMIVRGLGTPKWLSSTAPDENKRIVVVSFTGLPCEE
jgi:outer membrane protein OmpA-like peptidoglycan-associated protein